jgi:hypothetical protein
MATVINEQQGVGAMNQKRTSRAVRGGQRRVIGLAIGLVSALIAILPAVVPGSASAASTDPNAPNGSSAAVVTPLLKFFEFGNSIGTPLLCSDAGSVVSIIGVQTGAGAISTPLVNELNSLCSKFVSQGNGFLQKGVSQSSSLSLINPIVDPLLAALANGLNTLGTQYGPSLAPFGPTVAGLGGTVAFFEGS